MIAYLEKFLALVERFVVAHEALAAGYAKSTRHTIVTDEGVKTEEQRSTGTASDAAAGRGGRGRSRATGAGSTDTPADDNAGAGAGATGGRRNRSRAADTSGADAGAGSTDEGAAGGGRRSRTRAGGAGTKPETKPDTPEQADTRAEIESLCQLCGDLDEATADVKDYFNEKGWNTATDIPADELDAALNEMNVIADKYFD